MLLIEVGRIDFTVSTDIILRSICSFLEYPSNCVSEGHFWNKFILFSWYACSNLSSFKPSCSWFIRWISKFSPPPYRFSLIYAVTFLYFKSTLILLTYIRLFVFVYIYIYIFILFPFLYFSLVTLSLRSPMFLRRSIFLLTLSPPFFSRFSLLFNHSKTCCFHLAVLFSKFLNHLGFFDIWNVITFDRSIIHKNEYYPVKPFLKCNLNSYWHFSIWCIFQKL